MLLDLTSPAHRKLREAALKSVEGNKGAPGIDGMRTDELRAHLITHWKTLRESLHTGKYRPKPVRRVSIEKPDGGERHLGIPCAQDRWIQQCLVRLLEPIFEAQFSPQSYGFRPKRGARQALKQAQQYMREGYAWVVDIDLKSFFDRVNHDILMACVARHVKDKTVLRQIRSFLESGILLNGVKVRTEMGTPQGGPLSPLLANILLTQLDRELERRGHRFVRYADDCNIYVKSQRAGLRVMASVTRFIETKLKLQINQDKSAVDQPWNRKFLGLTVIPKSFRLLPSPQACRRFRTKVRRLTNIRRSQSLEQRIAALNEYLRGWHGYYSMSEIDNVFEKLDKWVRRRLRACVWRTWKLVRTRIKRLIQLGLSPDEAIRTANTRKGPWRMAASPPLSRALPNRYWDSLGLFRLSSRTQPVVKG